MPRRCDWCSKLLPSKHYPNLTLTHGYFGDHDYGGWFCQNCIKELTWNGYDGKFTPYNPEKDQDKIQEDEVRKRYFDKRQERFGVFGLPSKQEREDLIKEVR